MHEKFIHFHVFLNSFWSYIVIYLSTFNICPYREKKKKFLRYYLFPPTSWMTLERVSSASWVSIYKISIISTSQKCWGKGALISTYAIGDLASRHCYPSTCAVCSQAHWQSLPMATVSSPCIPGPAPAWLLFAWPGWSLVHFHFNKGFQTNKLQKEPAAFHSFSTAS